VRSGIRMIVESEGDIAVVAEAEDGVAAVREVKRLEPDVVLMDVRMPELDGIEATRLLAAAKSPSKVIMLTTFDQDEHVYDALRAGASGFLLKSSPPARILEGVRLAAAGEGFFAPTVMKRLVEHYVKGPMLTDEVPRELASLTERERDVLRQVCIGHSNAEIAELLFVSEATVKTHISHLLLKLGLRDRVQAVIVAYECGFVNPSR
jgi:DNA-binding NarL/FixJ family response regulator